MKIISSVLLVLVLNLCQAQERSIEFKLLNQTSYFKDIDKSSNFSSEQRQFNLFDINTGIAFKKNKFTNEILLNAISFNKNSFKQTALDTFASNMNNRSNFFVLNLEFRRFVDVKLFKNERLQLKLGLSINPSFTHLVSIPKTSGAIKTKLTELNTRFYFQPRLDYRLNEKMTLEFGIPIKFFEVIVNRNKIFNNQFSPSQQVSTSTNANVNLRMQLINIGLNYRLK